MKYIAPAVINVHNALACIKGGKSSMNHDNSDPSAIQGTSPGYEADE